MTEGIYEAPAIRIVRGIQNQMTPTAPATSIEPKAHTDPAGGGGVVLAGSGSSRVSATMPST